MQTKIIKLNTQGITQECSRILGEGLDYLLKIPLDKSWGAAMTRLVEYKCEKQSQAYINKHKIYQVYKEINDISMQDI